VTPKPRLVNLEIVPQGQEAFSIGSYNHKAIHYDVKVKIGGVAGIVAPNHRKAATRHSGMGACR
jgi:hypothetical protein